MDRMEKLFASYVLVSGRRKILGKSRCVNRQIFVKAYSSLFFINNRIPLVVNMTGKQVGGKLSRVNLKNFAYFPW